MRRPRSAIVFALLSLAAPAVAEEDGSRCFGSCGPWWGGPPPAERVAIPIRHRHHRWRFSDDGWERRRRWPRAVDVRPAVFYGGNHRHRAIPIGLPVAQSRLTTPVVKVPAAAPAAPAQVEPAVAKPAAPPARDVPVAPLD